MPAARPQGPGEYTSVFGADRSYAATDVSRPQQMASAPAPATAGPPPGMAPAPIVKPKLPLVPVVIGTAFVLLILLGLLVFFLNRK
jgi:hypothetical protein